MADAIGDWPFWVAFVVLACGAMCRGQLVYWIGRVATEQTLRRTHPTEGWRRRAHAWLSAGGADAGVAVIRRWGLLAIPFSYVTIGLQSMIQAGAGVLRIQWWKYTLAQIPGALAWGAIYSTFGFVTWAAVGEAASGNPLAAAGLMGLAVVLVLGLVLLRRRKETAAPEPDYAADSEQVLADPAQSADRT